MKNTNQKGVLLFIGILLSLTSYCKHEVMDLRTLGLKAPIGIESNPSFSWKTGSTERGFLQSAYEIVVKGTSGETVWSSGKIESSKQTDVPYEGEPLKSRTRYLWSVTTYDQNGIASEGAESHFETGILTPSEWDNAKWIASKRITL